MNPGSLIDDRELWDYWGMAIYMPSITAADELGLFAALEEKPEDAQTLGVKLNVSKRAMEGLASMLACLGLLDHADGKYCLNAKSRTYLLPGSPYYWGDFFKLIRARPMIHSELVETLRNDRPSCHDASLYELSEADEARAADFTAAMHNVTLGVSQATAELEAFDGVRRLLDVGGGSGSFSVSLAAKRPDVACTIFELANVCKAAAKYIREARLEDRVKTWAGNFFTDDWPAGHDAFFFSNIFHNWPYDDCLALGRKAFAAAPSGGRIFLQEMLLHDGRPGPTTVAANTLIMLWSTSGKQFTQREIQELLEHCGWRDIKIHPTFGYYSLISGVKP